MIPNNELLTSEIEVINHPNLTYHIDFVLNEMRGMITDAESLKQHIFMMLSTERFQHSIYSWNYGVELIDLFGQPNELIMAEIQRKVEDCLSIDNRIINVDDFGFETNGNKIVCNFTVNSVFGEISIREGVVIDV
jgi:Protein of unknown function (DUF2634).